jgi:hypothetical protein
MEKTLYHECTQKEIITKLDHSVHGNAKPGLVVDTAIMRDTLNAIFIKQKNISGWIKWGISLCFVALVSAFAMNVNDHYKVERFPDTYASKQYMMQVLTEFQKQTQILENADLHTKEDIIEVRKQIDINSTLLKTMNMSRGGKPYITPIKQ